MKLTIERAALLKSLGHVQSVVERRNTIPILSQRAAGSRRRAGSRLTATDMDLAIVEHVAGRDRARRAPPPCRRTRSTTSCASCPRARRSAGAGGRWRPGGDQGRPLALHACRPCRRRISRPWPPATCRTASRSPAVDLRSLIDRTRFAISTEETRYYLNGIYLHAHTGGKQSCCARWRPTATAWRGSRCRCPKGADEACPASSSRARRWARCAS